MLIDHLRPTGNAVRIVSRAFYRTANRGGRERTKGELRFRIAWATPWMFIGGNSNTKEN